MRWLVRVIQVLYTASLLLGFCYWWYVWQVQDGAPPVDSTWGRWARAHPRAFEHSFDPVVAQLSYPVFRVLTRWSEWTGFWSILRRSHLGLVLLIVFSLLLLFLTTPDVSGFRS